MARAAGVVSAAAEQGRAPVAAVVAVPAVGLEAVAEQGRAPVAQVPGVVAASAVDTEAVVAREPAAVVEVAVLAAEEGQELAEELEVQAERARRRENG